MTARIGGDAHGHTIAKVIEHTSEDLLEVEQGSLYPALHRIEDRRWVSSYWGASENNRKAKFYRLTAKRLKPLDPVVLSGVIATLLEIAVLACLAPAWRASRLDPIKALRTE